MRRDANVDSYVEKMILRACNCDMGGQWRPSAVLETMQESAGVDCERVGLGRPVLDGMGIAWVASRYRVELRRAPRINEQISVETYATAPRHLFYPRMFVFRDGAGETISGAYSLWLLMDMQTRRAVRGGEAFSHLPDNADAVPPVGAPGTVRPLEVPAEVREYLPQYCDFDLNGHVNNTRYLDWCCNALGVEALRDRYIQSFDINYESEIRPGDAIETRLARQDDHFTFCGFADGKRCFAVAGTLAAR